MDLKALYKLSYGMYIVTSRSGDLVNGQIANTVFQVSAEPPTVAVSINRQNLTWEYIKESRVFTVSVLDQDTPLSFIGQFGFKSGRDGDKFAGVRTRRGQTGAPVVLDHAAAYLEARVTAQIDVSTHTVFIGEILDAGILIGKPVMTYAFYHQIKRGDTPPASPVYIKEQPAVQTKLATYRCSVCGWEYDPEIGDPDGGIAPGTAFEEIPDSWTCPVCGAAKSDFEKID